MGKDRIVKPKTAELKLRTYRATITVTEYYAEHPRYAFATAVLSAAGLIIGAAYTGPWGIVAPVVVLFATFYTGTKAKITWDSRR